MTETCAACKETFWATAPHRCESKAPDKADHGKTQWSLIPWGPMKEVAKVFAFGAKKYVPHGWKTVKDGEQRYKEAMARHALACLDGELHDAESGFHTAAHVISSALIVLAFQLGRGLADKAEGSPTSEAGR